MTPQALPNLALMLDAISDPAILLDRNYRICAANSAYRTLFGENQASTCYEVSHGYAVPCDQAGETCPLQKAVATQERQRVLHIHNTPQGREHVDVELTPVTDELGNVQFFVEVMRPINLPQGQRTQMLGFSPPFTQMLDLLSRAAKRDVCVMLLGESGTGKELAARYLHDHSDRAPQPFVTVECSGLTESLFESELFGHEKGAFTGAVSRKLGLVEAAAGGTLFLDEIGDAPLSLQLKLLRLIETGSYRAVGSTVEKRADFRLVCATHRDLSQMVHDGSFRQDLYYRISPFPVLMPALRQRREDIPLIARHLLALLSPQRKTEAAMGFSDEAMAWLCRQSYPGNIRELRNLIERATILCDGPQLQPEHLQSPLQSQRAQDWWSQAVEQAQPLADIESLYLQQVSNRFSGDNRQLAEKLGISERTLYRKLQLLKMT